MNNAMGMSPMFLNDKAQPIMNPARVKGTEEYQKSKLGYVRKKVLPKKPPIVITSGLAMEMTIKPLNVFEYNNIKLLEPILDSFFTEQNRIFNKCKVLKTDCIKLYINSPRKRNKYETFQDQMNNHLANLKLMKKNLGNWIGGHASELTRLNMDLKNKINDILTDHDKNENNTEILQKIEDIK